jgi:riboflavin synthase|tara:strand:+ start:1230 stop:1814 length:585 start_codon:yes stop_codon:yes gene_type:complete
MFNGIIYNHGIIRTVIKKKNSILINIETTNTFKNLKIGSSIACDGVCLTLYKYSKNLLWFYISNETLIRSSFNKIRVGQRVNLEQSIKYGQNISGHYVQGHVDTRGIVKNILIIDKSWTVRINIDSKFRQILVDKASIAINGISLTISKIVKDGFEISIIPHTLKLTNLNKLKKKDLINIEFDIFGKYLTKLNK